MKFRRRYLGRPGRLVGALLMVAGALAAGAGTRAAGQDALRPPAAPATATRTSGGMPPSSDGPVAPPGHPRAMSGGPSVIEGKIKYNGTPTPGAPIEVGIDGPLDPAASYNWVQIDGPPSRSMTIPGPRSASPSPKAPTNSSSS
jgi:hypothetical protein